MLAIAAPQGASVILELKPEQKKILDWAARSGMSPEEVLDQAFAVIRQQYANEDWMLADRGAIAPRSRRVSLRPNAERSSTPSKQSKSSESVGQSGVRPESASTRPHNPESNPVK
jgi:hypothetical protein